MNIEAWIEACLRAEKPRARSLVITIFGDSIAPYRAQLWLGDLIALLAPFGVNERLVRTSVYRLSEAGWLGAQRQGRRSHYRLAPRGRRRFQEAYERVYTPPPEWRGGWVLAILPKTGNDVADRADLRRELEWEGFGCPAPGVFLRPADDMAAMRDIVAELGLAERVFALQTQAPETLTGQPVADLLAQCWALDTVAAGYRHFTERFAPLLKLIESGIRPIPAQAFVVQTLLIDAFRRVTLHDPRLPAKLLPDDWPGHDARHVCRALYRHLCRGTLAHLSATLEPRATDDVPGLPDAATRRFGGLFR